MAKITDFKADLDYFIKTFYRQTQPIYFRQEYYDKNGYIKQKSGFIDSTEKLYNLVKSKNKIHISIFSKNVAFDKSKRAINSSKNARSTSFFVIDIDTKYLIDKKLAMIIYEGIQNLAITPEATALITSGSGMHLYFKISEIYFNETIEKSTREKLNNLYYDTVESVKSAYIKAIDLYKKGLKSKIEANNFQNLVIESLNVDKAVKGNTQQLIRCPLSFNKEANTRSEIVFINSLNEYSLGELIRAYKPKKDYSMMNRYVNNNDYSTNDAVFLNYRRLNDLFKLANIRKDNDTLVGCRQKIMIQGAWLLVNIANDDGIAESEALSELIALGKIIGSEFKTKRYCEQKLRHAKQYFKTKKRLKNKTIIEWLEINTEEALQMVELKLTKQEQTRIAKRMKKLEKKQKAIEFYFKNGQNKSETAREFGITPRTVYNWVDEYQKEKEQKEKNDNVKGQQVFTNYVNLLK